MRLHFVYLTLKQHTYNTSTLCAFNRNRNIYFYTHLYSVSIVKNRSCYKQGQDLRIFRP